MEPPMRSLCRFDGGLLLAGAVLVLLCACGSGDLPLEVVDPEAAPLQPTFAQVQAILERHCAPCHDRGGRDYSSCDGIERDLDGLRGTVLESGSMPPGAWPRLDERQKLLLERWLEQGACAPCAPCDR
jgi:hypothetical protein